MTIVNEHFEGEIQRQNSKFLEVPIKLREIEITLDSNKKNIKFSKINLAEFYPALRKRVEEYFTEKKISRHANGAMIGKTLFILSVFVLTYVLILSNLFHPWIVFILALMHGFFTALIGLNIAHDAIHGAYSSSQTVNKMLGICFNIVGANDYIWSIKHNVVHHTFTNIPGHDDDIKQLPIMRLSPAQKLWKIHRFQHFYVFLLYPLATLSWVFIKDYINFFRPGIANQNKGTLPKKEIFRLFFYKAVYYTWFLAVPLLVIDLSWYYILPGIVALHLVEGITLSLVFQLAHVVEGTHFPVPDEYGKISDSWAVHQMHTTADFARSSPLVHFLFGGLNFQIEHHLFPGICHIHYRAISPIVRQTAMEFNLPFIENRTFLGAVQSHLRLMKKFGRE